MTRRINQSWYFFLVSLKSKPWQISFNPKSVDKRFSLFFKFSQSTLQFWPKTWLRSFIPPIRRELKWFWRQISQKAQSLWWESSTSSTFAFQKKSISTRKAEWKIWNLSGQVKPAASKEQEGLEEFATDTYSGLWKASFSRSCLNTRLHRSKEAL